LSAQKWADSVRFAIGLNDLVDIVVCRRRTPERLGRTAAQPCRSNIGAFVYSRASIEVDPTRLTPKSDTLPLLYKLGSNCGCKPHLATWQTHRPRVADAFEQARPKTGKDIRAINSLKP